jgi:hypothetical protein
VKYCWAARTVQENICLKYVDPRILHVGIYKKKETSINEYITLIITNACCDILQVEE